ncbi:bis(5'-nucleosyl)-tetraphosphatase [Roseimaritima ulvae]|uniref:Bis(5'-nucleosyl)-tetraphosphatase [asymmetrical] n=1 Tax=Roseimaritima ulvae TaxID=980254 RepID=A0A5B9QV57_9BACT|nr:NUDIX domain-containing protein [Roseimaritima ulvae]QEG42927.1 Putative mutator protein MutT4 [Roseimaritima ulvae]
MAPSPIVYAAGVLLLTRSQPRQFLLMKHPDRWDLPKGHAEPGESAVQTAVREMQEETGIDPASVSLDPQFRHRSVYSVTYRKHPDQEFEKRLTIFLGWVDQPQAIACSEHAACEWMPWDPPHHIQAQAIDPLLAAVEAFLSNAA